MKKMYNKFHWEPWKIALVITEEKGEMFVPLHQIVEMRCEIGRITLKTLKTSTQIKYYGPGEFGVKSASIAFYKMLNTIAKEPMANFFVFDFVNENFKSFDYVTPEWERKMLESNVSEETVEEFLGGLND